MGCICQPIALWFGCSFGQPSGTKTTITSYKKRYCTDIPCLALFIAIIGGIIGFLWMPAFKQGNFAYDYPLRILKPHDYKLDQCGVGEHKDKPFAYWPVVNGKILKNHQFMLCTSDCNVTMDKTKMGTQVYPSKGRYGYCLPHCSGLVDDKIPCMKDWAPELKGKLNNLANGNIMDVVRSRYLIAIFFLVALILCFLFIFAMKLFAGPIVYCSIFAIITALAVLSIGLLSHANGLNKHEDPKWRKALQIIGYVIAGIDALFTLIIFCLRNRIKMAVEVVKSTSRAFEDIRLLPFFPIVSFIISGMFFCLWAYVALYLFATSDTVTADIPKEMLTKDDLDIDGYDFGKSNVTTYQKLDWDKTTKKTFSFHLFLLFWIGSSIYYCTYVIIAGVIADWYFTPRDANSGKKIRKSKASNEYVDKVHFTSSPIWDSMWRTLRFHLGTIVFAALIISIVRFIRFCVLYSIKIMDGGLRPNVIQNYLKGVVMCLLKLLECILDKMNKNALIYNAIYGDAFCPSAVGSFKLIWSNLIRAAFISMISRMVTVLGKVMITLISVSLCAFVFLVIKAKENNPFYSEDVSSPILPLFIIGIVSYFVAKSFLAVYDTAIDTVFLCFLVDEKQNGSSGVMMADDGLKSVVSKYEDAAKKTAENSIVFRNRGADESGMNSGSKYNGEVEI